MQRTGSWSDEELAMLRDMAPHMTCKKIAEAISRAHGTNRSRNSVIGMAHRQGVGIGKNPPAAIVSDRQRYAPRPRPVGRPPRAKTAAPRPKGPSPPKAPSGPPYAVWQLRSDSCCWIAGDPRVERPFECGEPALGGKPYCAKHCLVAWPPQPRGKYRVEVRI